MVRGSIDETLKGMLEAEAEKLTQATQYETGTTIAALLPFLGMSHSRVSPLELAVKSGFSGNRESANNITDTILSTLAQAA